MSSWEGDPDAHDRRSNDGDDPGDIRTSSNGGSPADRPVDKPAPGTSAPTSPTGLGLVPADERGIDPFPSTGSLLWAPDPTESVPVVPDDQTEPVQVRPSGPPVGAPDRPASGRRPEGPGVDWPAPSGPPLSSADRATSRASAGTGDDVAPTHPEQFTAPPSQAYADKAERPAHFAGAASHGGSGGAPRRLRTDLLALGVVGVVLVVAVAALVLLPGDGGSDDPGEPAIDPTPLVGGDAADPAGPIVGSTGVIGSWSGSEWVPRPEGEQAGAGLDYTILGLGDAFDTARGEAIPEDCVTQGASSGTDIAVDLGTGDDRPAIAVAGIADPRPRPVEQLSTDAPVYQQAAADVVAGLGGTAPPTLTQLLRVDIDGSGTDEIVVAAEHISDPAGLAPTAGDWSVVFLRRVAPGGVATDVLASSVVGSGAVGSGGERLERIQVATVADLNRDGVMEVALTGRSATDGWTAIHAVDGEGAPSEVLRAGCER